MSATEARYSFERSICTSSAVGALGKKFAKILERPCQHSRSAQQQHSLSAKQRGPKCRPPVTLGASRPQRSSSTYVWVLHLTSKSDAWLPQRHHVFGLTTRAATPRHKSRRCTEGIRLHHRGVAPFSFGAPVVLLQNNPRPSSLLRFALIGFVAQGSLVRAEQGEPGFLGLRIQ